MTESEQARAWREAQGFSREQLAQLTGYAPEAIQGFEAGKYGPRAWRRYKAACLLAVILSSYPQFSVENWRWGQGT